LAYAELVSVEGDARSERQSSSPNSLLSAWRSNARRFARLAFAIFVLVHCVDQAFRARSDATRPEPGLELSPWFVAAVLLVVWLPFALFAGHELRRALSPLPRQTDRGRALAAAERLSLLVVVLFTVVHVAHTAWPLLAGSLTDADLRPELILTLSTTSHGLPVQGIVYLCGVGASSFYAVREALAALPDAPRTLRRAVVALGVLGYALGSYAVIRCASGEILP
jgi:hypothetical protein